MRRLLVTIVVLAGVLLVADRVAIATAQSQLAAAVQQEADLADKPSVDLIGFPFLTQAVRGEYDGGRLEIRDLRTEKLLVERLTIDLREVAVPLSDLLSGSVATVPVGRVNGVALVTYPELAKATGVPGLRISPKGDRLQLNFAVKQFGTSRPVVASARVGVSDNAVRITSVEIQGSPLPEQLTSAALNQVQSSLAFGALPYGLNVGDVRVAETGVEVSAQARNAFLRPTETP